jgi:hypothetical protein
MVGELDSGECSGKDVGCAERKKPRACSIEHKWPSSDGENKNRVHPRPKGGSLEYAGSVVRLIGMSGAGPRGRPRKRQKIREWSLGSRRRLLRTCLAVDWDTVGVLAMVTLTYPGEGGAAFVPRDGRTVHAQLRRFLKRWKRQWGMAVGVWKLEFQRRGAPHLHLFLSMPSDISLPELRQWVARRWWRIVGSGDPDHLRAGTGVERWDGTPTRYAWKYAKGDPKKEHQHQVPDGFHSVGRWWGFIDLAPRWITIDLTGPAFVHARRALRKWRRATSGYRVRLMHSTAGFSLFTHQGSVRHLVRATMRAATIRQEASEKDGGSR